MTYSNFTEGLELLKEAIAKAGYTDKVEIGMDVAASGKCWMHEQLDSYWILWLNDEHKQWYSQPTILVGVCKFQNIVYLFRNLLFLQGANSEEFCIDNQTHGLAMSLSTKHIL